MLTYLEVYQDARRKFPPMESLYYAISDAKKTHPSLNQFFFDNSNNLIGSINRSARILFACIHDCDDFAKVGIKEETVRFTKEQLIRAYAHLAHYLGTDTLNQFVKDVTDTPLSVFGLGDGE